MRLGLRGGSAFSGVYFSYYLVIAWFNNSTWCRLVQVKYDKFDEDENYFHQYQMM